MCNSPGNGSWYNDPLPIYIPSDREAIMSTPNPYPALICAEWLDGYEDGGGIYGFVYGHWNGWTVPGFTREGMEEVARQQNRYCDELGDDTSLGRFTWEGDVCVYSGTLDCDFEDAERLEPNDLGHYFPGDGWCWEEESDAECWIILVEYPSGERGRYAGWFASETEARGHVPADPGGDTYHIIQTA